MNKFIIHTPQGKKTIGPNQPCFIVAEISGNHGGSYAKACKIVDAAAKVGADAVKLQTFKGNTITLDCQSKIFQIKDGGLWDGKSLHQHYEKTHTPWEWHLKLRKYAESKGLVFFSSPFDYTAVDFLEKIKVPMYKVASLEVADIPLLERIGKTKKPVIISRGTSTIADIKLAIKTLKDNGCPALAVLHCVSSYPAKSQEMNILTIPDITLKFKVVSGLSDHSLGDEISIAAVSLGASIIEKHICLSRKEKEVDSAFSLEPAEFKSMVDAVRKIEQALGRPTYTATKGEKAAASYRKSLFASQDIKKGDKLVFNKNFRSVRPGAGLEPKYYKQVNGMLAKSNIKKCTPLSWKLITK